ncbi:MAG: hypothetical protein PHI18_02035 [bacterium]|nr:hypothetical protein [bacterium]
MKMTFWRPFAQTGLCTLVVLLSLILVPLNSASGQKPTILDVRFSGEIDTSCNRPNWAYLVGAVCNIVVTVLPDGKKLGQTEFSHVIDWSWPTGLTITAGQASYPDDAFQPSTSLTENLQLEYYVTEEQALQDSAWRITGRSAPPGGINPGYRFAFHIPPELADLYICVMVEWNHPTYGLLRMEKPLCKKIVEPCSEAAQHSVWTSHVRGAYDQRKYDLSIALADSFLALGWHDQFGLVTAGMAAQKIRCYDDAVRFLDRCFQENHSVEIWRWDGLPPLTAPTDADRREYERQRARLMELKNQQQPR